MTPLPVARRDRFSMGPVVARRQRPVIASIMLALLLAACSTSGGGGQQPIDPPGAATGVLILGHDARADAVARVSDPHRAGAVPSPGLEELDPRTSVVVIFNHGSTYEGRADPCQPDPARPGSSTPDLMRDLAGRSIGPYRLVVFAFCTPTRVGAFDHVTGSGELKLERRVRDIAALVVDLHARGLPAERLFVAGQSAGGFASLLLVRRSPGSVNAAIAFAPAFAGVRATRPPGWQAAHDRLFAEITRAPALPALVYAFEGDGYETPETLAGLSRVPGTQMRVLSPAELGSDACALYPAHILLYASCFRRAEAERISAFIADRVMGTPRIGRTARLAGGAMSAMTAPADPGQSTGPP